MPKRCALGCPFISGRHYHQFPHPVRNPDRFKEWVGLFGGKLDSQDEIDHFRKKVVCEVHFTDKDKNRNNRLNRLAVPTLHLDGKYDGVDSSDKGVLPSESVIKEGSGSMLRHETGLSDHETSTQVFESEPILDLPSESSQYLTGLSDSEISAQVFESESILDFPSESNQYFTGLSDPETSTQIFELEPNLELQSTSYEVVMVPGALDITSAKTSPLLKSKNKPFRNDPPESRQTNTVKRPDRNPENTLKEHSYFAKDKTDIAKVGESKYHQPTTPSPSLIVNQLQIARKKVKQLQSEVIRLRKRNKVFKTRLINAKKNSKHNCLQKITQNMTAAAKTFTHMQYTQTQKRNKGRRFTLEGQELCLSIYKSNPQCYDLLSKVFTLPSAKTIKRLIRKQRDIQPGLYIDLDEGTIQPGTFGDEPNYMDCVDIF